MLPRGKQTITIWFPLVFSFTLSLAEICPITNSGNLKCCDVTCPAGQEPYCAMPNIFVKPTGTGCQNCPQGQFSGGPTHPYRRCDLQKICTGTHMIYISNGSATTDATCGCEDGYKYSGAGKCDASLQDETTSASQSTTERFTTDTSEEDTEGPNVGKIVGIVLSVLVVLFIPFGIFICCRYCPKRTQKDGKHDEDSEVPFGIFICCRYCPKKTQKDGKPDEDSEGQLNKRSGPHKGRPPDDATDGKKPHAQMEPLIPAPSNRLATTQGPDIQGTGVMDTAKGQGTRSLWDYDEDTLISLIDDIQDRLDQNGFQVLAEIPYDEQFLRLLIRHKAIRREDKPDIEITARTPAEKAAAMLERIRTVGHLRRFFCSLADNRKGYVIKSFKFNQDDFMMSSPRRMQATEEWPELGPRS